MKTNCDAVKDLLPQYADGTLEEDRAKSVRAHLDECEACRSYLEEIKKVSGELDRGEVPAAPVMDGIGALAKIKKRLMRGRLTTVLITVAAVLAVLAGTLIYANMHYTYIPYEDTGIVVRNNEIRTSENYARLIGISDEIDGENVEFIFLLSNTVSRLSALKGEITIEDMDANILKSELENEEITIDIIDKVYYLPESAISRLPFLIHTGYMQDDLEDPNFWKKLEENLDQYVLVWSREA